MRHVIKIVLNFIFFIPIFISAQELFPNSEPASLIPKKVFGLRLMNEHFKEVDQHRVWQNVMLMYGVSSKLMITASTSFSNHHGSSLPDNFVRNDGTIGPHTHGITKGIYHPYRDEAYGMGFRYRFFNRDEHHTHLRMALYGNAVYANQAHDEAEVNLMGDNTAAGGGMIVTFLKNRFAVSTTLGAVVPASYTDRSKNITLQYANTYNYNLSFGYLVLPFKYKGYNQTNLNVYAEFLGRSYDAMKVFQNGNSIITDNVLAYAKGNYVEFRPALQLIIKSSLRIDFSRSMMFINRSYIRTYPTYQLNLQYYFL